MSTEPTPQPPPESDPLGEALHMIRLTGTLYCRAELTAPWGIDLPPMENCMMFHIVTEGSCWLMVEGQEPLQLQEGMVVLVARNTRHKICSAPEILPQNLFDIPVHKISDRYEIMHYGGGGKFTHSTCGVMRFDHATAEHLLAQLPPVLTLNALEEDEEGWLKSSLGFIAREARELRPGGETIITRLADILVIQMIRSWLSSMPEKQGGWLSALKDPQIGRALVRIHKTPEEPWSVASLASVAGMSRSAFSARFTDLVGMSAGQYLTHWRMQVARSHLREHKDPLYIVAERVGYQSEASFSRAFKRTFGVSPGSVRQGST